MENELEYPHYMDVMPKDLKEMWEKCEDKQRIFIVNYVESGNARQSAIKSGYSKEGARQAGYRLLTYGYIKPVVNWMTAYVIENALDTSISTASERMQILTDMSRATIDDYINDDGNIEITLEGSNPANIKELTTRYEEDGKCSKTIKMYSSVDAIKELNKMQGSHAADRVRHVDKNDNDVEQAPIIIKRKGLTEEDLDEIGFVES